MIHHSSVIRHLTLVYFVFCIFVLCIIVSACNGNNETKRISTKIDSAIVADSLIVEICFPRTTSNERMRLTVDKINNLINTSKYVETTKIIPCYNYLEDQNNNEINTILVKIHDDIRERLSTHDIITELYGLTVRETTLCEKFIFNNSNIFELDVSSFDNKDLFEHFNVVQNIICKLYQQPEIESAVTFFNPFYPTYLIEIDIEKVKNDSIQPELIFLTLKNRNLSLRPNDSDSSSLLYVSDSSLILEELNSLEVPNNKNEKVAISRYITFNRVYGLPTQSNYLDDRTIPIYISPNTNFSMHKIENTIKNVMTDNLPEEYEFNFRKL